MIIAKTSAIRKIKIFFVNLSKIKSVVSQDPYSVYLNIPMDVAIYNNQGKYIFTNKEYLADEKSARSLINKDDLYYAQIAGISPDSFKKRNEIFKRVLEKKQSIRFTEKLYLPGPDRTLYYKRIFQPQFSNNKRKEISEVHLYGSSLTSVMYAQRELKYLVYHDNLTGLKNRNAFLERVDQMILEADRNGNHQLTAILLCDIDNFKNLNDALGSKDGDTIIKEFAKRFKNAVRKSDTVFRIGGDEFAVILRNLNHEYDASRVAEKMIKQLSLPYKIANNSKKYTTVSIGISLFPRDGKDRESLIKNANGALKNAKKMRTSEYQFFSNEVTEKSMKRLEMENNLRVLVNEQNYEKQFEILYQPVVEKMLNGEYKIIGCEALLRWNNPDLGAVSPETFIPIAEETDLICPIGDWVLYKAINDFKSLMKKFNKSLYLSINLSARQMRSPHLVRKIDKIITHTEINPHDLHLELTETSFLDEGMQVLHNIDAIEKLGIKIDIDDFGVGFASLKYLQKFPVSTIKIDRSFIQHLNFSREHKKLVESIIILGKNLNKDIIAEGVENLDHLYMLYTQKCYKYQGFLFSKPITMHKFERLLQEEKQYHTLKASMGNFLKMDNPLKA